MRELKRQEFQAKLQYAYMHHRLAVCGVKMPRPRLLVKLFCKVDTLTWIEQLPRTISPNLGVARSLRHYRKGRVVAPLTPLAYCELPGFSFFPHPHFFP